jgi:hypothetical protein
MNHSQETCLLCRHRNRPTRNREVLDETLLVDRSIFYCYDLIYDSFNVIILSILLEESAFFNYGEEYE